MHDGCTQTNVPLASFVTCYARIKLFRVLESLGERILYYDTDSIIFISDSTLYAKHLHPKLGDYLGDFTDELKGQYITEFVSAGDKNYAKLLSDGSSECVVKDI